MHKNKIPLDIIVINKIYKTITNIVQKKNAESREKSKQPYHRLTEKSQKRLRTKG